MKGIIATRPRDRPVIETRDLIQCKLDTIESARSVQNQVPAAVRRTAAQQRGAVNVPLSNGAPVQISTVTSVGLGRCGIGTGSFESLLNRCVGIGAGEVAHVRPRPLR
jgi:hypothetical protein